MDPKKFLETMLHRKELYYDNPAEMRATMETLMMYVLSREGFGEGVAIFKSMFCDSESENADAPKVKRYIISMIDEKVSDFVGRHLPERETENWRYYETETTIIHLRKEHIVSVVEVK